MDTQILSKNARVLSREGIETRRAEVAIWRDTDGSEYIRVGQTLLWRLDVLRGKTQYGNDCLTCLLSGMTVIL